MSTPVPYPLINGVRHSFSSIILKLQGQVFIGFKSIEYSRTRSRGIAQGNHPDPLGKTRGKNEYKATVELYLAEWNAFQAKLGAGYGDKFFHVTVSYAESGFDNITDSILGCTMDTTDGGGSEGTDPSTRKFEINPLKIKFNGLDDLAKPLVGVPQ